MTKVLLQKPNHRLECAYWCLVSKSASSPLNSQTNTGAEYDSDFLLPTSSIFSLKMSRLWKWFLGNGGNCVLARCMLPSCHTAMTSWDTWMEHLLNLCKTPVLLSPWRVTVSDPNPLGALCRVVLMTSGSRRHRTAYFSLKWRVVCVCCWLLSCLRVSNSLGGLSGQQTVTVTTCDSKNSLVAGCYVPVVETWIILHVSDVCKLSFIICMRVQGRLEPEYM